MVATGIDMANMKSDNRGSIFHKIEKNNFTDRKAVNTAVNSFENRNNRRVEENLQSHAEKAFVPEKPVDPRSLQTEEEASTSENQQQQEMNVTENNVVSFENKTLTQREVQPEIKRAVGDDLVLDDNVVMEAAEEAAVNATVTTGQQAEQTTTNSSNKAGKSLGGIFGFFTGSDSKKPTANEASNDDAQKTDSSDESGDLVFNDDVLNVPSFLRNKDSKVSND